MEARYKKGITYFTRTFTLHKVLSHSFPRLILLPFSYADYFFEQVFQYFLDRIIDTAGTFFTRYIHLRQDYQASEDADSSMKDCRNVFATHSLITIYDWPHVFYPTKNVINTELKLWRFFIDWVGDYKWRMCKSMEI